MFRLPLARRAPADIVINGAADAWHDSEKPGADRLAAAWAESAV
jgi:hypothetical protein